MVIFSPMGNSFVTTPFVSTLIHIKWTKIVLLTFFKLIFKFFMNKTLGYP